MARAEALTLWIELPSDATAGDIAHVYWDDLSGDPIDYAGTPLTGPGVPLFPGVPADPGYGRGRYGYSAYGGTLRLPSGYGRAIYGHSRYGHGEAYVPVGLLVPRRFGVATFGVVLASPRGDVSVSAEETTRHMSASSVPGVSRTALDSYAAGVATFSWTASTE